ncbi:E3 ubiquitin-protein ligase RAD18 isoform X2 [Paramormyrops kingsleyae]|uniref:E3 ubiquitin-protein ligase RAD18 isoform X2 n=1 Tax=Paramormyrops kingsleyae TaxID=1676925 RepID=UPI003B96D43F
MMSVVPEPDLPTNLACLKPVDALLRCPVCFDYTNIAMMTKCSHNFCSLCIRKFLSYKPQCPVCNSTATESDLRNNRILDDLVKSFKDARHKLTQTTFESPPISPKTPVSSVRRNAMKPGLSKVGGTILNHFFQKRSPTGSEQSRTPKVQKDSRQGQQNSAALVMSVKEEQVEVSAGGPMSSSAFPSSSASPNQKPAVKVECPVCNVGVPEQFINKHLDSCLSRDEKRESLRSSIVKRKPLPKLVYHLLSSQELKKRLRELHLSTQGPRVQLERRHQEFVHIYNSQCDSLSPQSVEDIAKEVERDEKLRNQPELKHPPAMVFSKTQTEEEIEEIHANYRKQHSAEFSRLISQVKGRWKSSKTAKVKEETQDGEEARGEHSPALNTECLNDLGSCSLVTAEAAVMSEVPPRSPSPALSSISISSSISDVFSPEPKRKHEHKLTQTTFESPPISPKTPVSSVRRNAMKPGLSKVGGTILNHFFQKRSPTGSEQSRTPKVQKDSRQGQQNSAALVMSVKEEQVEVSAGGPMSSSAFPSSSASPNQKPVVKVECPVCNVGVPEQYINKHLDSCLTRDEKKKSLRSSIVKRKPLPKLVYHLLSSQELKKRLRELHLSTQGPRVQLERRHQEFVHIYNSQCDSLSPQSVEDIAKEVERDEKLRNQPELKQPPAMVFSKTQTEEEIEEIHANYPLNTECLNDLGSCLLVTAEAAVMSKVPPRSPSPALSSISISSSISDVFSPEPKRKHEMRESTPSRKHMASSPQDADLAPLSTSDKRARWH